MGRKEEKSHKIRVFNELKGNLSNSQQIFHDLAAQSTVYARNFIAALADVLLDLTLSLSIFSAIKDC